MTYEEAIFYVVGAVAVIGSLGVVTARNVVHSALFLIMAVVAVAGVFILLSAEFLALVQILIYGGAVTILILFAMMLTRVRDMPEAMDGPQKPLAVLAAVIFCAVTIVSAVGTDWGSMGATEQIHVVSLEAIGNSLFTNWSAPFELASLVLVVAMLGAIILARGEQEE